MASRRKVPLLPVCSAVLGFLLLGCGLLLQSAFALLDLPIQRLPTRPSDGGINVESIARASQGPGGARLGQDHQSSRADADEAWRFAGKALVVLVAALLVASPLPATARDGAIAPPTCVSIVDAATNCPARPTNGAGRNAEQQRRAAEERLRDAEQRKGGPIGVGESETGEAELVAFWRAEQARLKLNQVFLEQLRSTLSMDSQADSPRFVSRLAVSVPDVEREVKFWCEAVGMQRYDSLPGGGAVVAFGPPALDGEDEGGFFAIELRPRSPSSEERSSAALDGVRLSFVQLATPSLIRISRVYDSGGELIDGYGYYGLKSPGGVEVRAYVDDRRDPFEFVALAAPEGSGFSAADAQLRALGLKPRGAYQLVSPETQEYMPPLPPGSTLYAGSCDPRQSAQVLLEPIAGKKESGLFGIPRGPTIVTSEEGALSLGMLEQPEEGVAPISTAGSPTLSVVSPASAAALPLSGSLAPPTTGSGLEAVQFDLQAATVRK